jgi:hypothetical protein
MEPIFQERQRFTSIWLWILLLGIDLLILWGVFQQVILGEEFGNQPASDWGLILTLVFCLALTYFFFTLHLDVKVFEDRIDFRFFPMQTAFRSINCKEIDQVELRQSRPLFDFGGWGIRFGRQGEQVFNVRGREVIYLSLQNGKKVVLGTQRGEALLQAIEQVREADQ